MTKLHPECGVDEIYLGNFSEQKFQLVGWKTKRMGKIAYDIHGERVYSEGFFPVFVSRKEMESK